MQEQETSFLIKAICAKENRRRLKKLFLGAILLNVGGFTFMYAILYGALALNDFLDKIF